jgi:hypothetical protein
VIAKSPLHRAVLAFGLATGILALCSAERAYAVPIRPDIRKLLDQPQDPGPPFIPARAGWHGPESAKTGEESPNPVMEKYSPAGSARAVRTALIGAAVPDWRVVGVILALIIALRKMRRKTKPAARPSEQDPPSQIPSAA